MKRGFALSLKISYLEIPLVENLGEEIVETFTVILVCWDFHFWIYLSAPSSCNFSFVFPFVTFIKHENGATEKSVYELYSNVNSLYLFL